MGARLDHSGWGPAIWMALVGFFLIAVGVVLWPRLDLASNQDEVVRGTGTVKGEI